MNEVTVTRKGDKAGGASAAGGSKSSPKGAAAAPNTNTTKEELQSASDYLAQHNFKVLVEWLTAETICECSLAACPLLFSPRAHRCYCCYFACFSFLVLHCWYTVNRPRDPIAFLRDVICEKIDRRKGKAYNPSDPVTYAKQCYQEASETADEEGQIHPRPVPRKPATLADTLAMRQRLETLEQAIKSSRAIAKELDPWDATSTIIRETCQLLHCDRATLFEIDHNAKELQVMVAKGMDAIRLPMGAGIAGAVAATGRACNIPDAYQDARFNSAHDEATGYKTKSILAAPVIDVDGKTVGVIQAINRFSEKTKGSQAGMDNYAVAEGKAGEDVHGVFTEVDEEMVGILAAQAGIALNNARLYQSQAAAQAKIQSLLDIVSAMHSDLGVNSLLFTITQRAHELVEADRCTMFLLDKQAKELMSLQGEVNLRFPMDKGLAGECCTSNKVINIKDVYADPRFNQEVDKKSGYRTQTMLCMPCQDSDGSVVGVIQLINKRLGPFTEDDMRIMESFLLITGPILAQSQMFQAHTTSGEKASEFEGKKLLKTHTANKIAHEKLIEEGDEEDDD